MNDGLVVEYFTICNIFDSYFGHTGSLRENHRLFIVRNGPVPCLIQGRKKFAVVDWLFKLLYCIHIEGLEYIFGICSDKDDLTIASSLPEPFHRVHSVFPGKLNVHQDNIRNNAGA